MPDDDIVFVQELVLEVPALRASLDTHLAYYDELLTHVFFGDLSQWVVTTLKNAPESPQVVRLLVILENGLRDGSSDTRDLIEQSFLENICGEAELAAKLPPLLANRYQKICGGSNESVP